MYSALLSSSKPTSLTVCVDCEATFFTTNTFNRFLTFFQVSSRNVLKLKAMMARASRVHYKKSHKKRQFFSQSAAEESQTGRGYALTSYSVLNSDLLLRIIAQFVLNIAFCTSLHLSVSSSCYKWI